MKSLAFVGIAFMVLGAFLISGRAAAARRMTALYKRWGVEVPEDRYVKQFVFIGVVLIAVGFLVTTGLIEKL
jgi:hypothetical protein